MEWYLKVVRDNYANFEGRARRTEYWMFTLIHVLILFGLLLLSTLFAETFMSTVFMVVLALYFIATIIPGLAVTIRRLHDTGKSGWYYLLSFIPYVGGLILLIFTVENGQTGPNQYGPDPKQIAHPEIDEIGKE